MSLHGLILSIDFDKAFDTVSWKFIVKKYYGIILLDHLLLDGLVPFKIKSRIMYHLKWILYQIFPIYSRVVDKVT